MTPKAVSRFEANLLRILWFILRRAPAEQAVPLIVNRLEPPRCLSRDAVLLVQDALAKGCMMLLARDGGWRRARHLRGERVAEGRLWERTPPSETQFLGETGFLRFSGHALTFLIWLTAAKPGDNNPRWSPADEELTLGDRLLYYFAYEALRTTEVAKLLRALPPFADHGLCRLAFAEDFAASSAAELPKLDIWLTGPGAWVLEALQPRLTQRWLDVEESKRSIAAWDRMRSVGQAQERILAAFLDKADAAGRRDLARFLLEAAARLLQGTPTASTWITSLEAKPQRLADRVATYRSALAFVRQLPRLAEWDRQARTVGYLDEGYAAAQLWKADWEHWDGETLCTKAHRIIRELEPLPT